MCLTIEEQNEVLSELRWYGKTLGGGVPMIGGERPGKQGCERWYNITLPLLYRLGQVYEQADLNVGPFAKASNRNVATETKVEATATEGGIIHYKVITGRFKVYDAEGEQIATADTEMDAARIVVALRNRESIDSLREREAALVEALRKNTIKLHGAARTHNKWLRFDECAHADCIAARALVDTGEREGE